MAKRAILLVSTNAVADQEDEFNDWYVNVHIPQILERVPGFVGARRFKLNPASMSDPGQQYLAIYEIEADDPGAAVTELMGSIGAGKLDLTTALDPTSTAPFVLYDAI